MKSFSKAFVLSVGIFTGVASMPLGVLGSTKVEASTSIKLNNVQFQTTDNVYLRSGAGTQYKSILIIPKNKLIKVTEQKGTWSKVTYSYKSGSKTITKKGWSATRYLKEYYQYTSIKSYFFTKAKTKLYPTPDTKHKESFTVASNDGFYSTQKIINSTGQTWYRVSYKGKNVYVIGSNVNTNSFTSIKTAKYQAKRNTYLYQSYGSDFKTGIQIPVGEILSSTKHIGDWYAVTYKGTAGYLYIGDFSPYKDVQYQYIDTNLDYYITNGITMLYSSPDRSKTATFTVGGNNGFASNQKVLNKQGETWYRVTFQGQTVYVNSQDVTLNSLTKLPASSLFNTNSNTPVFASFGPDFEILTNIPKGTIITATEKIGNWYGVTYNGKKGYVNSSNITVYQSIAETAIDSVTFLTNSVVSLNQVANVASNIIATIPNSTVVAVTAITANDWYKVSYNGKIGYVPSSSIMQVKTGDPITSRDSYQFIDLRTPSPVTATQINDYVANYVKSSGKPSVLTGKGQAFIDAGKKYGINALYLAAHAIHESGFGTSAISIGKNNLFGFGSYDITPFVASYRFPTVDLCIEYIASQLKSTYLNPSNWKYNGAYLGFSTKTMDNTRIDANSEGMNFYYASDPNWGYAIANIMQKILPYDKNYYSKAKIDTTQLPVVPTPNCSDVFPLNTQAISNTDIVLNSAKGASDKAKTLKKGSIFTLLEKTNDYWIKVQVGNTTYWTSAIKFDKYNNYMTVKNLFRTTASLNIRKDPYSSVNNIISVLNMNAYVSVVVKADGTLSMDSSKSWYQVYLPDGSTGWVSATYVVQELQKAVGK